MVGLVDFRRVEDPPAKVLYRLVRAFGHAGLEVDAELAEALAAFVIAWPKAKR